MEVKVPVVSSGVDAIVADKKFVDEVVREVINAEVIDAKVSEFGERLDWATWRRPYEEAADVPAGPPVEKKKKEELGPETTRAKTAEQHDRFAAQAVMLLRVFIDDIIYGDRRASPEIQLWVHSMILAALYSRSLRDKIVARVKDLQKMYAAVDKAVSIGAKICDRILQDLRNLHTPLIGTHELLWTALTDMIYGIDEL